MLEVEILSRKLAREKLARKEAENIAESHSKILYQANLKLAVRHEIISLMAEHFSLNEIIPNILQIMCDTMQLEYGGLWKIDHVTNVIRCTGSWCKDNDEKLKKFDEISKHLILPLGEGLPGRVWKNKAVSWIGDITQDQNFPRKPWAMAAGLRGAFAFPLLFEDEVLGVIEFFSKNLYSFDDSLIGMLNDITKQIGIFIERENAQKEISTLSRFAGMAEVASSILHNVGNTLNSINISVELLFEKIVHSKMDKLISLAKLLEQHQNNINSFLLEDSRGQHIPKFLIELARAWEQERSYFIDEIKTLRDSFETVKNIIGRQQSLAHPGGVTEITNLKELIEDSLSLNKNLCELSAIKITRDFQVIKNPVIIDRIKLFQILTNLIKNSIDSLAESKLNEKEIILRIQEKDDLQFMIQISDNGIGIEPNQLTNIFSYGYTTKKEGHGFGLHMCAIYAKEMGGELFAESEGVGKGASFTLILPYKPKGDYK